MSKISTATRTANNIIKTYGLSKLEELVKAFKEGKSCTIIAKDFGITRQRVNQWSRILGDVKTTFTTSHDVEVILGKASSFRTTI